MSLWTLREHELPSAGFARNPLRMSLSSQHSWAKRRYVYRLQPTSGNANRRPIGISAAPLGSLKLAVSDPSGRKTHGAPLPENRSPRLAEDGPDSQAVPMRFARRGMGVSPMRTTVRTRAGRPCHPLLSDGLDG